MCLERCVVKSCQKGESRVKSSLSELESQVESSYFKFWSLSLSRVLVESVAQSRVKSIRDFYRVESEMNFESILLSNREI